MQREGTHTNRTRLSDTETHLPNTLKGLQLVWQKEQTWPKKEANERDYRCSYEKMTYLVPQLISSDWSRQSYRLLHRRLASMHVPSSHWNWFSVHSCGSTENKTTRKQALKITCQLCCGPNIDTTPFWSDCECECRSTFKSHKHGSGIGGICCNV